MVPMEKDMSDRSSPALSTAPFRAGRRRRFVLSSSEDDSIVIGNPSISLSSSYHMVASWDTGKYTPSKLTRFYNTIINIM
jgi:hypothetical protein